MYFVFVLMVATPPANAGRILDFCARILIADNPYQFEQTPRDWLSAEVERLEIKRRWGTLTSRDASLLSIMRAEIKKREWLETFMSKDEDAIL